MTPLSLTHSVLSYLPPQIKPPHPYELRIRNHHQQYLAVNVNQYMIITVNILSSGQYLTGSIEQANFLLVSSEKFYEMILQLFNALFNT
jgi:hypothetical protein